MGGSPKGGESGFILRVQLPNTGVISTAGACAWGYSERGRPGGQIDNRTRSRCPIRAACIRYSIWEQVDFRLSWAWRWPELHSSLAPDPGLRRFVAFRNATSGGVGRLLRPGGSDDQGH